MENQKTNPVEEISAENEMENKSGEVCSNCGTRFEDGQEFCPKCGTAKNQKTVCGRCGAELTEGQEFCSKCGQKVGIDVESNVFSTINQMNERMGRQNQKKKKTPIIIAVSLIAIALLVVVGIKVAPTLFPSVEKYLEVGDYKNAYSKAKTEDEKAAVTAENNIAVCLAIASKNLMDPESIKLRSAIYDDVDNANNEDVAQVPCSALRITAKTSNGTIVESYVILYYSDISGEWMLKGFYDDLEEKEVPSISSVGIKAAMDVVGENRYKAKIKENYGLNTEITDDGVKRINALFAEGSLDSIEVIEEAIPVN